MGEYDGDELLIREVLTSIGEEFEPYDRVTNFEDLRAWQHARALTRLVFQVTQASTMARHRNLCDQTQRSAVSVMSNIAEGHERGSTREYLRFLTIAKASCAELRSQTYVALDAGGIDQATFDRLMPRVVAVNQLTGGLRAAIARKLADSQ